MDFYVSKIDKMAKKIEELEPQYASMSDDELKKQTQILQKRLKNGESLSNIMFDAYAVVREAAKRVLGMQHFHEQLMGGIALHEGKIAEMGTGEGKTLMSTLPVYLNALSKKGVHVITANEYLAARDAEMMGKLYNFLGLSVGLVYHGQKSDEKKMSYNADITYGTSSEFGFDYLRDNMVFDKSAKVCTRQRNFAIIDEADNVLIDEAQTPLIISQMQENAGHDNKVIAASQLVATFDEADVKMNEEENSIFLSDKGIEKVQEYYSIKNIYDGRKESVNILYYINNAIRAKFMLQKDVNYIVKDGKVLIVDERTGRAMDGRRFSNGLHQALEAKEGLKINGDGRTLATITHQNYFGLYNKLAGMTGTAKSAEEEFKGIFRLNVVQIPSHLPLQRTDSKDFFFFKQDVKFQAICDDIENCYKTGQPVLIGTQSIEESERLSQMLNERGIPHNVLNAKEEAKEASIISDAGAKGAVTISTNMAGRGTDIKLGGNAEYMTKVKLRRKGYSEDIIEAVARNSEYKTSDISKQNEYNNAKKDFNFFLNIYKEEVKKQREEVVKLGGLKVIGTSRNSSRRVDNQLIGRSGRQGDPGSSVFYVSAEDDLLAIHASTLNQTRLVKLYEHDKIDWAIFTKAIKSTQETLEAVSYGIRKNNLRYDSILNVQRKDFYKQRNKVLEDGDIKKTILEMIKDEIDRVVDDIYEVIDGNNVRAINGELERSILPEGTNLITPELLQVLTIEDLKDFVYEFAKDTLDKAKQINDRNRIMIDYRVQYLNAMDKNWVDYLESMEHAKDMIGLVVYAQEDPLISYQNQARREYTGMIYDIRSDIVSKVIKDALETIKEDEKQSSAQKQTSKKDDDERE